MMPDRHQNLRHIEETLSKLIELANAEKAELLVYLLDQAATETKWLIDSGEQSNGLKIGIERNERDRKPVEHVLDT